MTDFVSPQSIVTPQIVPTSATKIYTGSTTRKTKLINVSCTEQLNVGTTTLQLWIVPAAGSTANSNRIISDESFATYEAKILDVLNGKVLNSSYDIWVQASAANGLSIEATGVVFEDPSS